MKNLLQKLQNMQSSLDVQMFVNVKVSSPKKINAIYVELFGIPQEKRERKMYSFIYGKDEENEKTLGSLERDFAIYKKSYAQQPITL